MKKRLATEKENVLLIIEDFDFIRTLVGKEFQKNGYTIISVGTIEDAIFVGKTDPPAVVIVDFEMRSSDPYIALSILRNTLSYAYIILMNGNIRHGSEEKAREAGAQRTMERSFSLSTLDEIIHSASHIKEFA